MLTERVAAVFETDGALAKAVHGYTPRLQQTAMATEVARALDENSVLVAEASTGTGKTFAYLVPALLHGGKVLISTGTKNLQDQLFKRDLPAVRDALAVPVSVALLKGRSNYVCHYHLERHVENGSLVSREEASHLRAISRFAKTTRTGDKAELSGIPETAVAWSLATSTRDNCLGQDCPKLEECFVMAARREALAADVVVVNHHLFFADLMLRDEGVGELLPACNAVIFDEAHQLPETATLFFGNTLSTHQVVELSRDVVVEALISARDYAALPESARKAERAARDLRLALRQESGRFTRQALHEMAGFERALADLETHLASLQQHLQAQAERSEGLQRCNERCAELIGKIELWRGQQQDDTVYWADVFTQSLVLHATPMSVAEVFRRNREGHPRAWVFTSATLAVGKRFVHYLESLGLEDAQTAQWDSPFDYANQALLYVPTGLPQPNEQSYNEAVVEAAWPLIQASNGRAFVLCTSLRAMRRIHELLQEKFERNHFEAPLLLQGEGSKTELLDHFRQHGNAVLVASQSFWEGVDVRGEALQLVIIDRIPFAPPDDPVLAARIEQMRKQGRNPFMEHQLPHAVIDLKQGAGRLIRDANDRGVLMVCDPRLVDKPYGRTIWQSLPPMRRTRVEQEALNFLNSLDQPTQVGVEQDDPSDSCDPS